jgi:hypothetical protein
MRQTFSILAPVAMMLAAFAPSASANLQLTLSSGGTTVFVNDGGVGDVNAAVGQITFIGALGNWNLNVTTGTVGTNPLIDLNSVDTLNGAGTGVNALTLTFSATNYSVGSPSTFTSQIGGTLANGHSLTYQGYVNSNNALNGKTTPIGSLLTGFGSTAGGSIAANTSFSLTEVAVLSGTQAGTSSIDAAIDAVPEPATVSLLGGVLLATFGALRRKTRRA